MRKIIIEECDNATAYMLTYKREGGGITKAFGSLDRAMDFAQNIFESNFEKIEDGYGKVFWQAKQEG
jgi:hypothetical protein